MVLNHKFKINDRTLLKEQKICDLDLEFICKYGPLGYGYSHQLHGLSEKTPAQEVEDSVFFRLPGIDVSPFSIFTDAYM